MEFDLETILERLAERMEGNERFNALLHKRLQGKSLTELEDTEIIEILLDVLTEMKYEEGKEQ